MYLPRNLKCLKFELRIFGDQFLQLSVRCVSQEMCNAEEAVQKHKDLRPCHEGIK